MVVEAFGIEKEFLRSLLTEGASGKAQLPEFQRGWGMADGEHPESARVDLPGLPYRHGHDAAHRW